MAVTPTEALGDKLKAEQGKIDELEAKCDAALRKEWTGRKGVWISTGGYGQFVVDAVQKKFQAAGWRVKQQDDQREGSSLSFELPTPFNDIRESRGR